MKINIGDNIRTLRVLKGFSQEYMANELNISVSAYSNIERDVSALTVNRLIEIAEILSVKPSFILEMDNKQILSENDAKEYFPKSIESEFEKLKKQFDSMSAQFQKISGTTKKTSTKTKKR